MQHCHSITAKSMQLERELLLILIRRTGTSSLHRPIASTQEGVERQDVCLLTITVNTLGGLMEKQIDWKLLLQVLHVGPHISVGSIHV